jgi:2-polyprenyl-6-methoxyphenol hydroxylase-like FAD-dependent oxidoreductase
VSEKKKKALIIGSGIAGPAVALFLKRAGIESEIFEARQTDEGYSLSLSCNGVAVLKMLSLDGQAFTQGSPVSKWSMWNSKGKYLGGGSFTAGGIKSVFIKRASLGAMLSSEAERQGIAIHRGKKLQDIDVMGNGGVVATFQDGTTASGDLLVGADGVHSRARQFVDPIARPVYTGLINTGGYSQGVTLPQTPETTHFIFGRRAFFGYHVSPTGYIYWFVNYPHADMPVREAVLGKTDEERRSRLLALFREDLPFISDIIRAAETIFPDFLTYTLPTQPVSWHRSPVVLLGDAVHAISPSSGQGASMALEDAVVLAKSLRDIPDLEQAFEAYEHLRRERTVKMYDLGERGDSGKYITNPLQQWFRDVTTPVFLKLFASPRASDWIYSYRIDWDTPISTNFPSPLPTTLLREGR